MTHHAFIAFASGAGRLHLRWSALRWPVSPKWVPCSGRAISGMMLCRIAPFSRTTRLTSGMWVSLMPGISTELILTYAARHEQIQAA